MNLRSIRALVAFSATAVLFAACAAPPGDTEEGEDEDIGQAALPMGGFSFPPTAGVVKILVPNGAGTTTRTGVLLQNGKVLTGLSSIPAGVALGGLTLDAPGQGTFGVVARADNSTLGATLLTPATAIGGPTWAVNTAAPSTFVGHTVTCPGYSTSGVSLRALGTVNGSASPGYQVFLTTGSIDTTDDGVPCYDDTAPGGGITGIALSTSGSTHNQISGAKLAPWLADPTLKTLSLTRNRYHNGTGTVSNPAALQACNNLAYGATCSGSYMNTTTVSITASPGADSATQWTGCTSSSGNSCSVTMNGAKNVSVKFVGCTNCYDDCMTSCADVGGLPMSTCVPSCTAKCKGCGF